jgi:hypothetical protein
MARQPGRDDLLAVTADIRDPPALGVHRGHDVRLHEIGQPEVVGGERAVVVISGDAARARGTSTRLEVDADKHVRVRHVGADVPGSHVVVHPDVCQDVA